MENLVDALLFGDSLSSEEQASVRDELREDPDLAEAWVHWRQVRRRLGQRLDECVSDRRLLVLYVLAQEGDDAVLTAPERAALEATKEDIARSIEAVPALEDVVERIREERADFVEVWQKRTGDRSPVYFGESRTDDGSGPETRERTDRSARAPASRGVSNTRRWSRRLMIASLVLGLAVVSLIFWPQESSVTVSVDDDARQVVEVAEGITARLVGGTTLTYSAEETDGPQRVRMEEGRAFFEVASRPEGSPFVVETPTATATVLGTQFGVSTRGDTTEVVLATGRVRVDASTETSDRGVVLDPGQQSLVAAGEGPLPPTPVDLTASLDWTGLFVFRSMPVADVMDRLSDRYGVQITVGETLADEAVTGTFERDQSVEQVLAALAATLGADVQKVREDEYRLSPGS